MLSDRHLAQARMKRLLAATTASDPAQKATAEPTKYTSAVPKILLNVKANRSKADREREEWNRKVEERKLDKLMRKKAKHAK